MGIVRHYTLKLLRGHCSAYRSRISRNVEGSEFARRISPSISALDLLQPASRIPEIPGIGMAADESEVRRSAGTLLDGAKIQKNAPH